MTRDHIVALFARRQQAWDRLDAAALAADFTDDATVESPLAGGAASGRDAIEKLYATYFAAFPDFKMEQELLLIDGDNVAQLVQVTGTDSGGFMGMADFGGGTVLTSSDAGVFLVRLERNGAP